MTDILVDDNLELLENEDTLDLVEGVSDLQHMQLLLLCVKGSWKENPGTGVGLVNYLEEEDPAEMYAEINRQLRADGMAVNSVAMQEGKLLIDATYP